MCDDASETFFVFELCVLPGDDFKSDIVQIRNRSHPMMLPVVVEMSKAQSIVVAGLCDKSKNRSVNLRAEFRDAGELLVSVVLSDNNEPVSDELISDDLYSTLADCALMILNRILHDGPT